MRLATLPFGWSFWRPGGAPIGGGGAATVGIAKRFGEPSVCGGTFCMRLSSAFSSWVVGSAGHAPLEPAAVSDAAAAAFMSSSLAVNDSIVSIEVLALETLLRGLSGPDALAADTLAADTFDQPPGGTGAPPGTSPTAFTMPTC